MSEGGHVVEGVLVIEGIVLRLEIEDFSQLLVRCKQMSFAVIECQSDDRLFKHLAVFISHLLFFIVGFQLVGNVRQCADEVCWPFVSFVGKFRDTLFVHIAPFFQMLFATDVPAKNAFSIPMAANDEVGYESPIARMVIWVDDFEPTFVCKAVFGQ